ncbi:MAG: energy transducer TonB [Verrucomicrobiales bacterium]|nr:energy transducer TonB [Verrucomicrobiales bacterium]
MRKVFQPSHGATSVLASLSIAAGITALIFAVIPFSHVVAKPSRVLELRKTSVTDMPPPQAEEPPPPPEQESKAEDIAPPVAPDVAPPAAPLMADLDVAVGGGGYLPGFVTGSGPSTEDMGAGLDTFDVSELERRPEPVSQVAPTYPAELRKAKIEGTVTLVFLLSEEGRVEDPRVEASSRPEFEKPAVEAVKRWRFKPGMKDGQAVRTHMRLPIRFRFNPS